MTSGTSPFWKLSSCGEGMMAQSMEKELTAVAVTFVGWWSGTKNYQKLPNISGVISGMNSGYSVLKKNARTRGFWLHCSTDGSVWVEDRLTHTHTHMEVSKVMEGPPFRWMVYFLRKSHLSMDLGVSTWKNLQLPRSLWCWSTWTSAQTSRSSFRRKCSRKSPKAPAASSRTFPSTRPGLGRWTVEVESRITNSSSHELDEQNHLEEWPIDDHLDENHIPSVPHTAMFVQPSAGRTTGNNKHDRLGLTTAQVTEKGGWCLCGDHQDIWVTVSICMGLISEWIYTCIHACMHAYIVHPYMHAYTHECIHACMHSYMHTYMYAYMHACIRTCIHTQCACIHACMHSYMHTHTHSKHAYMHACMHTCIHTCMHTCMHAFVHAYTHTHSAHAYMHACVHACMHACMHSYMHTTHTHTVSMHTCMHAYMHTCMYPYIHTYIHPYIHRYIDTYIHIYIDTYIYT